MATQAEAVPPRLTPRGSTAARLREAVLCCEGSCARFTTHDYSHTDEGAQFFDCRVCGCTRQWGLEEGGGQ